MNMHAYTVFYCMKHNKGILVENIHKNIPTLLSLGIVEDVDNCEYANIGYITVNNNIIINDINQNIYFLNISSDSIYDKNFKLIKLDETNPLILWLKYYNSISEVAY